jgi:hypothetical protein
MRNHLDLSDPCIEVALKRRPVVPIRTDNKYGFKNFTYARFILLAYLRLPIDSTDGVVCHACNNEKCINPLHLYLGSQKDNIQDQILAGTKYSGGHKGSQTLFWKCTSPGGITIFKWGLKRVSEHTKISLSAISTSAKKRAAYRGWTFEAVR